MRGGGAVKGRAGEEKSAGRAPAEREKRGRTGPWRTVFWLLMFLPLAVTLAALVVLPDRVPMHYNLAGEVDRWGSKYENLIFPVLVWAMGGFFLGMVRFARRQGGESNGPAAERMLWVCGSGTLFLFNVMIACSLVEAGRLAVAVGGTLGQGFARLMFTVTGLIFLPLGNAMPKLRRNGWAGVRTPWSMKSDENWRRCQQAGGAVMMAAGAVMAAGNALFPLTDVQSLCFSLGTLLVMAVAIVAVTAAVSRKKG